MKKQAFQKNLKTLNLTVKNKKTLPHTPVVATIQYILVISTTTSTRLSGNWDGDIFLLSG